MGKAKHSLLTFVGHALHLVILLYGFLRVLAELGAFPTGLLIVLIVIAALLHFRIPAPRESDVEAILGKNISVLSEEELKTASYVEVVGHRGGGIDAPENTIAAYKNVSLRRQYLSFSYHILNK